MKIQPECVPCLLKRIIFEAEHCTKDKNLQVKTVQKACRLLADLYDPNVSSASIATKVHKIAYETLGDEDPYEDLKHASNVIAHTLIPRVEHLIKYSDNPLRIAMLCSIIGNLMDFGISGASDNPEHLGEVFEETFVEDLKHDDIEEIKEILAKSKRVILFTDNCGEIVFDKVLCKELKKFNPDIFLTICVKGEPIISDATMDDAEELEFDEEVAQICKNCIANLGLYNT